MALRMWGHLIIQAATPGEDPVLVGTLWSDTSGVATLKICTSVSPYTWAAISAGGGSAPDDAEYIVAALNPTLTAERLATDSSSITWDFTVAGVAKALRAALTGDVTASADSNATTIANDAVTYAKMQNVSAISKLLGRGSAAGAGDPQEITLGTNLSMSGTTLNATDTDTGITQLTGDVTAGPGSGSQAATIAANAVSDTKLRDSGPLSVIGRSVNSSGDPADISATATSGAVLRESGSVLGFGTVATAGLANDAVTYAKMQNVSAASRLLGRGSAGGAGDPEELTLATGLSLAGTVLTPVVAAATDVQAFTSNGTWTKPTGAKSVLVQLIGAGGGGGSGRRGAALSVRGGGGAGGGGQLAVHTFDAAVLGATETVTIGSGGSGGAAQTVDSTDGTIGATGGTTSFGSWLRAVGTTGGGAGIASASSGGNVAGSIPDYPTNIGPRSGGGGSNGSVAGTTAAASSFGPGGGGGGGGITNVNADSDGGTGGALGTGALGAGLNQVVAGGTAGTAGSGGGNGNSLGITSFFPGSGGGGGASSQVAAAGTGGNGALYGAGGGGGGASTNGNNSGAGGNGANGIAVVTTFF